MVGFMDLLLLIARLLLAVVFVVAGLAKLADWADSRASMADFGVPAFLARPMALLIPVLELACGVALLSVTSARWGASGALAMLLLFIAAIAINLVRGRRPDCRCFGQLHSSPIGWTTIVRNAALAGLAAAVLWQPPVENGRGLASRLAGLNRTEAVALAVALVATGLAAIGLVAFFGLLRQNGRLLLRLEVLEAKLGAGDDPPAPGLPVDSTAPDFSAADLDGETVTLDRLRERGMPVLLFFSEPGCGACDAAFPEVGAWQREHAGRLLIVPITRGDVQVHRARSREHNLHNVLLQADREIAQAYRAESTPSAVLMREGLIATPLAVGIDAIRALVEKATWPPPLKTGDRVPSLRLADLNGGAMDLAGLRGRPTLLLFWNPSCGFCQAMLRDVKTWERTRPEDAPEVLVIAAGSHEAIRAQGFRSRVLLDPDFGAGQIFGAGGTPSAIVLDEDGRVASEVGSGAPAVFALAGRVHAGSFLEA
jgi:peroxiredoxin